MTPLHIALGSGHKDIVELLIAKKANINAADKSGMTPLHIASGSGHKDIVELLISNGADINSKNSSDFTPLSYALRHKIQKEVADILLEKGGQTTEALEAEENAKNIPYPLDSPIGLCMFMTLHQNNRTLRGTKDERNLVSISKALSESGEFDQSMAVLQRIKFNNQNWQEYGALLQIANRLDNPENVMQVYYRIKKDFNEIFQSDYGLIDMALSFAKVGNKKEALLLLKKAGIEIELVDIN